MCDLQLVVTLDVMLASASLMPVQALHFTSVFASVAHSKCVLLLVDVDLLSPHNFSKKEKNAKRRESVVMVYFTNKL